MKEFNAEKKICLPKRPLCEIRQMFLHVFNKGYHCAMIVHALVDLSFS